NDREMKRKAHLIISMQGNQTVIIDPNKPTADPRRFAFDYSYWSHSGYKVNESGYTEPKDDKYIDQVKVFNDLGLGMLDNVWHGYNCCILAYGQTGSGKSYSIMGHGANKGLVPRTCEELFIQMDKRKDPDVNFEVSFAMYEIYNEQVRDLLNKRKTPPGGLKIRSSPTRGFYVEALTTVPVGSFSEIKLRMNEGDKQRTIAATKMNECSSRAHTIVVLNVSQNYVKKKSTKFSSITLVDLAGNERAKQTEATGDRFEELKNINKSLLTLGNVIIMNLHIAHAYNYTISTVVPYREASLTKLLKNALGGNSKTAMLATLSPDAENFEQTLSTLRYADRAKSIRTNAVVNHEATNKLIQGLIEEKERLLRELENARGSKKNIQRYRDQMENSEKVWQQRLTKARQEMEDVQRKERQQEEEERQQPHLSNLNEDPALVGKIKHVIKTGQHRMGNAKDGSRPEIILNGPRIAKDHALLTNKSGRVLLKPLDGLVLINGVEPAQETELSHQDRIRFGSNNLFVFLHPVQANKLQKCGRIIQDITFEFAQNEIAKHSGLNISDENALLQEEVMSMHQMLQDVNAMAEDMQKDVRFSILLLSAEARGLDRGSTEVRVCMHDELTGNEYHWTKAKFLNRQVHMQEMFQKFDETNIVPDVSKEDDAFWEPSDTPVMVGVASLPLNYLSHMLDFQEDPLTVLDSSAKQCGFLKVDLIPCDSKGNDDFDLCVDDPMDLIGKAMAFRIKIHQAMNLPTKFYKTWCRFRFYDDGQYLETDRTRGQNPSYSYDRLMRYSHSAVDHKVKFLVFLNRVLVDFFFFFFFFFFAVHRLLEGEDPGH
ncbi:hypothetical protein CAPTEDRAFT_129452, partial [Capitella teleta]